MELLMDNLPELLSLGSFAQVTGIPKETIRRLRLSGKVRAWQIPGGKRHLYPKSEVARVLALGYASNPPRVPPEPAPDRSHAAA
jgi:hypothetical protein